MSIGFRVQVSGLGMQDWASRPVLGPVLPLVANRRNPKVEGDL